MQALRRRLAKFILSGALPLQYAGGGEQREP